MKGYYASEFLYIAAIGFAKLSLLVIFHDIVEMQRLYRRSVLALGILIFTWSIASLLTIAFQCELPRPWEMMTLRCFNIVSGSIQAVFDSRADCSSGSSGSCTVQSM